MSDAPKPRALSPGRLNRALDLAGIALTDRRELICTSYRRLGNAVAAIVLIAVLVIRVLG